MTPVAEETRSLPNAPSVPQSSAQRLALPLWLATTLVFALALGGLMYVQGDLFVPSFDEGLNLEGAARLVEGQRPYVDFFGHASPGAYLYQGLVFRLAGQSIWTARILVLSYQSLQIALLYWLISRFASRKAAFCTAFVYALIETTDPGQVTAHHRWDSSTLGFLSIVMAIAAISGGRRKTRGILWWGASGLFAVAAAIATPTAALMVCATGGWLLLTKRKREFTTFAAGVAAGAVALVTWMATNDMFTGGRFGGYLGFLRFMKENYAEANTTSFGFVQGGWLGLFENAGIGEFFIRLPIVICLALPVLAPLIAAAVWGWWAFRGDDQLPVARSTAWYLFACQIAMLIYPFPRADLSHLAYTSAFACALTAIWMVQKLPAKLASATALFFMFWSLAFLYQRVNTFTNEQKRDTPIGSVAIASLHRSDVDTLLAHVKKGDTAFVYPFMPTLNYLTQTHNPTAFMFMQPGMMKDAQEQALLDDLSRTRPHWIVWFPWTRELFVKIFPGAANLPHRFPRIEQFFEANYDLREQSKELKYNLMELKTAAIPSSVSSSHAGTK